MSPRIRTVVVALAAGLVAIFAGTALARGEWLWPSFIGVASLLIAACWLLPIDLDLAAAGVVLSGYIAGNRGFAQLHPPGVPLLPAEALLMLSLTWAVIRHLPRKSRSPLLPPGALARATALWVILCSIRVAIDVRPFGFLAVRDYAVAYYALFFFLAAQWRRNEAGYRWLTSCLVGSLAAAPILLGISLHFPDWLEQHVLINGIPIISIKSDSAIPTMAGGAVWLACLASTRRSRIFGILALILFFTTVANNNRAGLVGLAAAAAWLFVARAWKILRLTALAGLAGLIVLASAAILGNAPLTDTMLYQLFERAASIVDFNNTHTYRNEALQDKGDNNTFRFVWWQTVIRRTWEDGRWFGLGFGYDLTAEFDQTYYPTADEELSVRSPHNVLVTLFARTGIVGFASFLAVVGALGARTWRTARGGVSERLGLELFAWSILVSACLGVVLEGPMGAVVFWMVLGLACEPAPPTAPPEAAQPSGRLPATLRSQCAPEASAS